MKRLEGQVAIITDNQILYGSFVFLHGRLLLLISYHAIKSFEKLLTLILDKFKCKLNMILE